MTYSGPDAVSLPPIRGLYWNLLLERSKQFGSWDESQIAEGAIRSAEHELEHKLRFRQYISEQLNVKYADYPPAETNVEDVVRVRVEWAESSARRAPTGAKIFDHFIAEIESHNETPKARNRTFEVGGLRKPLLLSVKAQAGPSSRSGPGLDVWIGEPQHDVWLWFESLTSEQMQGLRDEADERRTYLPFALERPVGEIDGLPIRTTLGPIVRPSSSARLIPLGSEV